MENHLYALIMAGGEGTRLWPLSRRAHPKQSLKLFGERTMFQLSVDRLLPLLPPEHIFTVTGANHVAELMAQVPEVPRENFIIEPLGRGTAPCIGLSALHLYQRDPDAVMAVVTADHFIHHADRFRAALKVAQAIAEREYLVTLGVAPTYPATSYGYIKQGESLGQVDGVEYFQAAQFTEKPDLPMALQFMIEKTYAWNSGMFIWKAGVILRAIAQWLPNLRQALDTLSPEIGQASYEETLRQVWPILEKQTIDYGIMEKADKVAMIPVDLGWSDIGAWSAVMDLHSKDAAGNVLLGDALALETENTMVVARGDRLVATLGVQDLIVVDTSDAVLVTSREQSQHVRDIVQSLRKQGQEEFL